jgi:transposase
MALHVAIDVHDRTLFAVGVDAITGEERFRRRFPHTPAGIAELLVRLSPGDVVVLEATRGSHAVANRLDESGATVLLADPQRCRLLGFRGKKSDYRDCLALLSHLRSGELATVWRPDTATRQRRQLTRERRAYNHTITQLKNRIIAILREEGLIPPGASLWEAQGLEWLSAQPVSPATFQVLQRSWKLLQATLAAKEAQEAVFSDLALDDPRIVRLMQIPGFGPVAAVIVLGEMGESARFVDGKSLTSYAGLDPRVRQSGDQRRGGRISKSGRSQLRWVMVEVAWGHVLANGAEAALYHRLIARGKSQGVAIVALARHLLVLAHLLLTRDEPYRQLDGWSYLRKLANLAAGRPKAERGKAGGQRDIDWAREQYRQIAGAEPPPRPAAPRAPAGEGAPQTREANPAAAAEADSAPEAVPSATAPAPAAEDKAGSTSGTGAGGCHAPRLKTARGKTNASGGVRRSPASRERDAISA